MSSSVSPGRSSDLKKLISLVAETRAAIDVVFEMVALLYSEKYDRDHYEVLDAMWQRHRQAVASIGVSADEPHPGEASPSTDSSL